MSTDLSDLKLGVGVATHGHDEHLARTLDAIDSALLEAGVVPVARVVAGSDGSTAAERIAASKGWSFRRHSPAVPGTLAAARETARRNAGGDAQLLVDGDVAVQAGWLAAAVGRMRADEQLAGVSGTIDEAHWSSGALVGGRRDVYGVGAGGKARQLRDAALWRRAALDAVGGFDPWLPSEDEAELAGRLSMAGFTLLTLRTPVAVRHGVPRDSFGDLQHYLRKGRSAGPGMVLRRARGSMAFVHHIGRYRAGILLFAWLIVGIVSVVVGRDRGLWAIWLWATLGILAFFAVMKQSLPRAWWRGVRTLFVGASVLRTLAVPFGLPRLGVPTRPIAPPKETEEAADEPARATGSGNGMAFRAAPRDDDEPPPLVSNF